MVTPLPGVGGPIGVIGFGLMGADRHYEPDDLLLAEEIARRLAPSIENALRFERQTATAEAFQRALLPEQLGAIPGVELAVRYLPGSVDVQVGGDWYDAMQLPGGSLLVAIGDVVGHGVPAATWMGKLRTLVQYCAFDGLSPAAMLARLNGYCMSVAGADMATALVGVLDPLDGRLCFASAGHPPPLVLREAGGVEALWGGRGPPLGATATARFEEETMTISPGDTLVLYTDGLVERRRESFDRGLERLMSAVGRDGFPDLERAADSLISEVLETDQPSDDVALLLLRSLALSDELHLSLRTDASELARLRRIAGAWSVSHGADEDEVGELLLALNEVAANAIEHAYGPGDDRFDVTAHINGRFIEVVVQDSGHWRARPRPTGRGRGLEIVRQMTDDLEIDQTPSGTTVRFQKLIAGMR